MKEKSFKFRESFANSIREMDDRQAGKLIKAICDYVFYGRYFESCDGMLNGAFALFKTMLDTEKRDRENGRNGGIVSAEKSKKTDMNIKVAAYITKKTCPMDEFLKDACKDKDSN